MTTKRNNDIDKWNEADWAREFDAAEDTVPATRQTKSRETTDLRRTRGRGLDPDDTWDGAGYVRWAQDSPDEAAEWLQLKSLAATLEAHDADLAAVHQRVEERHDLAAFRHTVQFEAAVARLELQAAEIRRKLGDEEINHRHKARQAQWREECAELKLYHVECTKARANHATPPPHPTHNKAGWKKWQEAQRALQFRHLNTSPLDDRRKL